ncbi:kinetochore protein Nuf2 isoform X3 [Sciurus carolinensis]|nr:kinetochore protein Nuf2 isoform X3 [Sciurus carolinensis]
METLSFPRYNAAELVVHIRNKILTGADGKNLSKNDLYPNPKPEVLHMIYMRALQIVYGIRLEHFYMMPVNTEVMYPHIMEGFLPVSNLFIHLDSFLPICRVNDFEIADILYPKAKRTSRFLSGIINFIHFREACRETYMEFLWQYKSSVDRMQQLSIAHQEALLKVESLNSVPVEEQEEFKQLTDDIQELQQSLNQEFRQKTIVLQEGNSHKKSAIAEKTKRLQEVMEKYETYRDSVDCLPSCQLEVQLYQKKIQDLADNKDKLASALKESLNLEDQIESAESELRKLKTEESSLRRLLIAKKEKLATTQFRINKKHEDIKQYKRAVIEDCNKVQEKRGAVYEQVTTINQEIQKIKFGMQQLKDATGREKLKSHEIFLNLRTALDKYHEGIEKATEECCTRIEEKAAELKGRMFRAST